MSNLLTEREITLVMLGADGDSMKFARAIESAILAKQREQSEPVAYEVGGWYKQQNGEWVQFVEVSNKGTSYETMCCAKGVHRYTRRDFGRVTGTDHGYSDEQNTPPTYAAPQPAPEGMGYEQRKAILEGTEIAASDEYFAARPQIDSRDRRNVFKAGFERGFAAAEQEAKP